MQCEKGSHPVNYNALRVTIYKIQETVKDPNKPAPEIFVSFRK
jgi:hypothetical protein